MKNLIIIIILIFTTQAFAQETKSFDVGDKFPDFELKTVEGEPITMESLKGKVVFLNFWFTACVPCIEEMPTLNNLQNAYKDKVEFIAITFNSAEEVKQFLLKYDFDFEHVVDGKNLLTDTLKNREYPRNLVLDRNGFITYYGGGLPFTKDEETGEMKPVSYTFFQNSIENALAK